MFWLCCLVEVVGVDDGVVEVVVVVVQVFGQ